MNVEPTGRAGRRIRWTPIVIIVVAAAVVAWFRLIATQDRGASNIVTMAVPALAIILLSFWVAIRSRWPKPWRYVPLGVVALTAVVGPLLVTIEGFSGGMIPEFRFRLGGYLAKLLDTYRGERPEEIKAERIAAAVAECQPTEFDFPQFLGPDRNGVVTDVRLATDWQAAPPKLLWRRDVGAGWSGFAVVGDRAVTLEQQGDWEVVTCYRLSDGQLVWNQVDEGYFSQALGGVGPRSTPAIADGKVYALGAKGRLSCLDLVTGERLWRRNILDDAGVDIDGRRFPKWGVSGSPLVVEEKLIVNPGGPKGNSIVAYHKDTGERLWGGGDAKASYSSPRLATLDGVRQVLIVCEDWLVGHDLATGEPLWEFRWDGKSDSSANVSQPILLDEHRVFISKGYSHGCAVVDVRQNQNGSWQLETIDRNPTVMKTKFSNALVHDGHVYGLDEGLFQCVKIDGLKRRWKRGRYGFGQNLLVGDVILVVTEQGQLALVELSPKRFRQLALVDAIEGKTWNNPALAGPRGSYLLVRNATTAACFELPLAKPKTNLTATGSK